MPAGGIRILVVDDSPFFRKVLQDVLLGMGGVSDIRMAANGEEAMEMVLADPPDAVTLDLDLPRMDGFTFLRWLMKNRPLPVVVVSAMGSEDNVFKALDLGALDFVIKPEQRASNGLGAIRDEVREKIQAVAGSDISLFLRPPGGRQTRKKAPAPAAKLPAPAHREGVLVVGASTGGPSAVQRVLADLPGDYPLPVVVVQHMPPVFTGQFARRLERNTSLKCKEAEDMDRLLPGRILVVPGGFHLSFRGGGNRLVKVFPKGDGDRFVPSVDITMKSAGQVFGPSAIGVLLTGMGNDGAQGLLEMKKAGGYTIAESEESAVVFGMPRAASKVNAARAILTIDRIGKKILERTGVLTGLKNGRSDDKN